MTVSYDFTGRTAVVTGASKGIGRRIAERLRDAGAQVWNFDLYPIELHGIRQLWVDVTDAGQIADAVAQLQEKTSRLGPPKIGLSAPTGGRNCNVPPCRLAVAQVPPCNGSLP